MFNHKLVRKITLNSEILNASYLRCIKGLKPYKKEHQDTGKERFSWIGDSLIIESLRAALKKIGVKRRDKLIFCSDNKKDFAEHDYVSKKYKSKLHPDISGNIPVKTSYYENLKKMFSKEFDVKITKETKQKVDERKDFVRGLLDQELVKRTTFGGSLIGEGMESTVLTLPYILQSTFGHSPHKLVVDEYSAIDQYSDFYKGEGM